MRRRQRSVSGGLGLGEFSRRGAGANLKPAPARAIHLNWNAAAGGPAPESGDLISVSAKLVFLNSVGGEILRIPIFEV